MPATKSKSKVTRTLRPEGCEKCYQRAVQRLDLTCKLERAEFERDVMLDVMAKALERATAYYIWQWEVGFHLQSEIENLQRKNEEQRKEIIGLLADLQLIQAGCTRELGGSVWIRGEQLAECLNRYTNGRCAK